MNDDQTVAYADRGKRAVSCTGDARDFLGIAAVVGGGGFRDGHAGGDAAADALGVSGVQLSREARSARAIHRGSMTLFRQASALVVPRREGFPCDFVGVHPFGVHHGTRGRRGVSLPVSWVGV